jgi:hypothetical protein
VLPTGRRAPGWRDGAEVVSDSRGGWRRSGCGTVGEGLVRQAAVRSGPGSLRQGERLLPIRCPTACRGRRTACWEETLHSWRTGGRAGSQAATRSVPDAGDWVAPSEPQPAPPSGAPTWFGTRHTPVSGATAPRPHTAGQETWCRGSAGAAGEGDSPPPCDPGRDPVTKGSGYSQHAVPEPTRDGGRRTGRRIPTAGTQRWRGQCAGRWAGQSVGRWPGQRTGGAGEGRPARRAVWGAESQCVGRCGGGQASAPGGVRGAAGRTAWCGRAPGRGDDAPRRSCRKAVDQTATSRCPETPGQFSETWPVMWRSRPTRRGSR